MGALGRNTAAVGLAALALGPWTPGVAEGQGTRAPCGAEVRPVAKEDMPRDVVENFTQGSPASGSKDLWMLLWPLDDVSFDVDRDRWLIRKLPWYRRVEGTLKITGHRRDGSGSIDAHVPGGYDVPGFVPSRITFPGSGCWRITGRLGDSTVRFEVLVPRGLTAICDSVMAQLEDLRANADVPENRTTLDRFERAAREKGCTATPSKCDEEHTPVPANEVPPEILAEADSDEGMIGNGALWVRRDQADNSVPTFNEQRGEWSLKFPWFRSKHGTLRVTGRRLDGPGNFEIDIPRPGEYADTGFLPTSMSFSDVGCWKITGRLRRSKVVFYLSVGRDDGENTVNDIATTAPVASVLANGFANELRDIGSP